MSKIKISCILCGVLLILIAINACKKTDSNHPADVVRTTTLSTKDMSSDTTDIENRAGNTNKTGTSPERIIVPQHEDALLTTSRDAPASSSMTLKSSSISKNSLISRSTVTTVNKTTTTKGTTSTGSTTPWENDRGWVPGLY